MKKVLILANNDVGLYKFRKELIQELVKSYEVYVSLPYGEFVPELEKLGCIFMDTPISRRGTNPITDLKLLINYIKFIRKINPDVVLTYTIKPNVYGGLASRLNDIPYIANITGLGSAVENDGALRKVTLFLYKQALKKASCVFFQNIENQDFFKKKQVFGGKSRLLPGSGVNLEYYSVLEYPSSRLINFLFIARVMEEKGINQYLEAAEYIKGKYSYTVFHILGYCEQDYEGRLKKMQDKGIIQYHGMQSDTREFQRISHCTIHPSYYSEGMSNVLLESAASGRPIITTNKSGCKEIVDEGINGYLVHQRDAKSLINKIEHFLNLNQISKMRMGLAGRTKVEKEFDRKIVVDAYKHEVEKVLGE